MIGASIDRAIHRWLNAGVMWAMIPLAAMGGMPTTSCACVDCHCGIACRFAAHDAPNPAATADSHNQAGCCSCCGCAQCPCAAGCCCCQMKKVASKAPVCKHENGTGASESKDACKASISAVVGIRPTLVVLHHEQPLALAVVPSISSLQTIGPLDRTASLNTGPPIDLVLTLQHLLI